MEKTEIRALTGLRGVAALLVVVYHFYPYEFIPIAALSHAQSKGYLWVDLFFVLSGYVMALNYARLFSERLTWRKFGDFLLRRVARIYPLYAALLIARLLYSWLCIGNFHDGQAWAAVQLDHPARDLVANLLLVQSWGLAGSINGPAWSVSTEFAAYLAFPVLVTLILGGRRGPVLLACVIAALLLAVVVWLDRHDGAFHSGPLDAYDGTRCGPLLRCFAGFTLGLVTFRVSRWRPAADIAGSDGFGVMVLGALLAGLLADAPDLLIYPCFPALVLCLGGNRGRVGHAFGCRPVFALGLLSYSIYLLHVFLIGPRQQLQAHLPGVYMPGLLSATLIFGLLLLVSGLAYVGVEKPGRRLIRAGKLATGSKAGAKPLAFLQELR